MKLEWIGEICVTLPRGQIERLRAKAAVRARKAAKAHGGARTRNNRRPTLTRCDSGRIPDGCRPFSYFRNLWLDYF